MSLLHGHEPVEGEERAYVATMSSSFTAPHCLRSGVPGSPPGRSWKMSLGCAHGPGGGGGVIRSSSTSPIVGCGV